MIRRLLVAVDDSPDAFAAVRFAIQLAGALGAGLRIVHVSDDHVLDSAVAATSTRPGVTLRRARGAAGVLDRVASLAEAAHVEAETRLLAGPVGPTLLHAAHDYAADLVVIGRSTESVRGAPYVGALTRHVLEFAEQPVIVVPRIDAL